MIPVGGQYSILIFFTAIGWVRRQVLMSRSNPDLLLAVAAGVVVVYDWGKQDIVRKLLTFL
jgi:hypothetical protein